MSDKLIYDFKIEYSGIYYYENCTYLELFDSGDDYLYKNINYNNEIKCFIHHLCKLLNHTNINEHKKFHINYLDSHKCESKYCFENKDIFNMDLNDDDDDYQEIDIIKKNKNIYNIKIVQKYEINLYKYDIEYNIMILANDMKDEQIRKDYLTDNEKNDFQNFLLCMEKDYDPNIKYLISY